jgi:hypothetical protein
MEWVQAAAPILFELCDGEWRRSQTLHLCQYGLCLECGRCGVLFCLDQVLPMVGLATSPLPLHLQYLEGHLS